MTVRITPTSIVTDALKIAALPSADQAVLADATIVTWIAPAAGSLISVKAFVNTACTGAGGLEKTEVDVTKNGVTCLTGVVLINAAATTVVQTGTLAGAGAADFVAGDKIRIVNNYTADGGGANTGAALVVSVCWQRS